MISTAKMKWITSLKNTNDQNDFIYMQNLKVKNKQNKTETFTGNNK